MSYTDNAYKIAQSIQIAINYLNDEQAEVVTNLFPIWQSDTTYNIGDRRQFNNLLYSCIQEHISQNGWEPPNTPALWKRTFVDEWPEWIQPSGAQDVYNTGDKVSHNTHHWISLIDNNVWEPGVYGWQDESLS